MTRYALYFTPPANSLWSAAGSQWLGRHATTGQTCPQPLVAGLDRQAFADLTADARRYGFHATLKAPFHLANGYAESDLLKVASAFCALQKPVPLHAPRIGLHGDFLALQIADADGETGRLASRCVSYFDLLRAPPTDAEMAKRRREGLTLRQEELLLTWGYPHTEELFQFHMTLSGSLKNVDRDIVASLRQAARVHFSQALKQEPLSIDGLSILREECPGEPFVEWKRFDFSRKNAEAALPSQGRLFYCVGPSGVGRATLLQWAQQHLTDRSRTVFAQRVMTRPAYFNESHEAVDFTTFWQLAAAGQFAMVWQHNDLCYGIRRDVLADLRAGCDVVVNGSPSYLSQLRTAFPDAIVVWIGTQENLMQARSDARQSEAGPVSLKRLYRSADFMPPDEPHVVPLDNSGSLEAAGKRLLGLLEQRP